MNGTDYAEAVATALHATLNRLAMELDRLDSDAPITVEDLRNTLLELAENIPAPE